MMTMNTIPTTVLWVYDGSVMVYGSIGGSTSRYFLYFYGQGSWRYSCGSQRQLSFTTLLCTFWMMRATFIAYWVLGSWFFGSTGLFVVAWSTSRCWSIVTSSMVDVGDARLQYCTFWLLLAPQQHTMVCCQAAAGLHSFKDVHLDFQ